MDKVCTPLVKNSGAMVSKAVWCMVRQLPVNLKHFTANKHDAFSISLLDNLADPAIWPTRERKREQKRSRTAPATELV